MPWQLWRQDDNGNRFLVGEYVTRELAEQRLTELTSCQHKQTYWLCQQTAKTPANDTSERPLPSQRT